MSDSGETKPKRTARRAVRLALMLMMCAVLGAFGGFFAFVNALAVKQPHEVASADGIVVLTGAAARIGDALKLLRQGKAKRLLISGVHARTSRDSLRSRLKIYSRQFDCCVDLGRLAQDTAGNAEETADWVRSNNFSSLILVTSSYHMPRSLVELRHSLPGVAISSFPVVASQIRLERWWANPGTLELLAEEYVKFLASLVITRFEGSKLPPDEKRLTAK